MNRYYLTQRPPAPGTFPGKPANIKTYDERKILNKIEISIDFSENEL